MICVDVNCDLGEGMANDAALMPYISSANIACGFHAGDDATMRETVRLAIKYDVAIGAHPGFPDKANFGRIEMPLSQEEVYNTVVHQLNLLQRICEEEGATLHHVKPHGALYNMAARSSEIAHAIAGAVYNVNKQLILYGLSGSSSITEARRIGLRTASEVFADRAYDDDGSLTPRSQPRAMIEDEKASIKQVLQMLEQKTVRSINNKIIPIVAQTICIHGDGKKAVAFAKSIHQALKEKSIVIRRM